MYKQVVGTASMIILGVVSIFTGVAMTSIVSSYFNKKIEDIAVWMDSED